MTTTDTRALRVSCASSSSYLLLDLCRHLKSRNVVQDHTQLLRYTSGMVQENYQHKSYVDSRSAIDQEPITIRCAGLDELDRLESQVGRLQSVYPPKINTAREARKNARRAMKEAHQTQDRARQRLSAAREAKAPKAEIQSLDDELDELWAIFRRDQRRYLQADTEVNTLERARDLAFWMRNFLIKRAWDVEKKQFELQNPDVLFVTEIEIPGLLYSDFEDKIPGSMQPR